MINQMCPIFVPEATVKFNVHLANQLKEFEIALAAHQMKLSQFFLAQSLSIGQQAMTKPHETMTKPHEAMTKRRKGSTPLVAAR